MADIITTIIKDESLSANVGNVVKIVEKDYNGINNKPQINGVTLQGNKSALELGLVPTDLSKLEAVEQPIKSVRQAADMFVDNGGKPSKIALQQVKDMSTKVVYADELGNVDFKKLDIDDYVILGDKIYRVVDAENNIKQLLPETSAEHVTFADKKGKYTSTNVEDALTEIAETVAGNNEKLTSEISGVGTLLTNHKNDKDNPHGVTKTQVGLGNVDNTADLDKPISNAQKTVNAGFEHNFEQLNSNIDTLGKGLNERIDATNSNLTALRESTESALSNQQASISDIDSTLNSHITNQNNPHNVTKAQVGLDKVDNTADNEKTVKEAGKVTQKLRFMGALDGGGLTTVPYDGSKDTSVTLNGDDFSMGNESSVGSQSVSYELKKTGVTAGAYNGITVDEKGRVTAAQDKGYATKQELQEAVAGKVKTFTYDDYQKFVEATNSIAKTGMGVGDNVYIKTLEVPDMWVTRVNAVSTLYTYTGDQAIVNALHSQYGLTVGYFSFSKLETEKVDLTNYQQTTDSGLNTTNKTVVGAINEVKGTADNALSKANANASEISKIKDGTTKVKEAEHADTTDNATNVTTNINGKAISSIFETNGITAKEATHAGKATSADKATQADSASKVANNLTFSGQNARGTESIIGFNGSQAREVAFNGDDFLVTNGNAFEVSLAPSGATAGTYNNVTVDEKGRVTGGENKDYSTTEQVNAKYTKPESGIPKSDLAEDVKTSLRKADTAVQSDALSAYAKKAELAIVATSGSYSDLQNIPTDIAKIGNLSNPNLLINPNFAINQRGQSEYTNTKKTYTVDRTSSNRSVITPLQGGGIKLNVLSGQSNPYIQQIIENAIPLVGKQLTFSISIDGVKYSHTVTTVVPSADSTNVFYNKNMTFGNYTCNLQLVKYKPSSNPYSVLLVTFTIANPNDTIINWWKLEIGSVATEFSPPNIAEELQKCYRYYKKITNLQQQTYSGLGIAYGDGSGARTSVEGTFRVNPTITSSGAFAIVANGEVKTVSSMAMQSFNSTNVVVKFTLNSALADGLCGYLLSNNSPGAYIALDAEI